MRAEYDFSKGERGRFFRDGAELDLPASDGKPGWAGKKGRIGTFIVEESRKNLKAYREQPKRVTENANTEEDIAGGGYAHRQLFELVQNSADALALRDAPSGKSILIRLTERFLYCADDGSPIDEDGVEALMFSRLSPKRGTDRIGRFGLGFKSVLKVTDAPEFFSRSGSFRFDRDRSRKRIREVVPDAGHCPVLRLPEPIDPDEEEKADEELRELMGWATNIVRLPLKPDARDDLAQQIRDFPPEFLLFVDHVRYLTLEDGESSRDFTLRDRDGERHLDTGEETARWRVFETNHPLSDEARSDWRLHDDGGDVPIRWVAPLDRLDRPGHFWAFFPTHTPSLVAGILNAPWKTNEDRQNLLPGPYNKELIEAAAAMIAEALPELATDDDPARHLDALPRRREAGDSDQAELLRKCLFAHLHDREIVPDQDGNLRVRQDISYPPDKLTLDGQDATTALERWAASPDRPSNWLHHKALTRNRLAIVDRLFHPEGEPPRSSSPDARKATIAKWLEALVEGKEANEAVRASMASIQTAAAIPPDVRSNEGLGEIVLTANGEWRAPDPERLFLPSETQADEDSADMERYVHLDLVSDRDTLSALKEIGLKPPSSKSRFKDVAKRILDVMEVFFRDLDSELRKVNSRWRNTELSDDRHREFWVLSRELTVEDAFSIIREFKDFGNCEMWPEQLRVRTQAGDWKPLHSVRLPDGIAPNDENRDDSATVDTDFHGPDDKLLRKLGVTTPRGIEERRNAIRQKCSTDAERLLEAVGEDKLRAGLPDLLLAALERDGATLTGPDLAKAAIDTWDTDALKQYKQALNHLEPPGKWAGLMPAVKFVRSLGFSPEWAGERDRERDPFLEVEGPYSLPELHDYQRTIADNVRELLRGGFGNGAERRGMISLPTGSGKTRVAVQAIVEAMREDGFRGGVLWIADRDELCEQAVEAWRQVWSSEGPKAAWLRISRMWGKQSSPPRPTNQLHVVVATIQTLHARLSKKPDKYGFLVDFNLVVFDEAHRSIAPTFTSVMQKIGLTRSQGADGPFMLGLTATPYRGHNEKETRRLAGRYGNKRLDWGAFESNEPEAVIQKLQGMGVLAQADHKTIKGETFSFDPAKLAEIRKAFRRDSSLPWLPQSVEDRIARNTERTKRIVEAYEKHVEPDWPTLIFATSVEHAQTLAALLNRKGISSRAVSGKTEPTTRRRVVEEFRRDAIKVLVNYGVFREGFDAPRTRAIIVARPVYSPNLYFQMIGRGLRGPKNGGNERCLILNVEDNIENFDLALAFSELDWLWA